MVRTRQAGEAAKRLRELRNRSGLSVRDAAEKLGVPASTYASWEQEFKKPFMPFDRAQALAAVLVGLGNPPITMDDVMELAGVQRGDGKPLHRCQAAELTKAMQGGVPEIDVLAGAGLGGDALTEAFTDAEGNEVAQDVVKATWGIPEAYAANVLGVRTRAARIIEVRGDSMAPTLVSGDRVMVDTNDRLPSPDGLFALHDGLGVVVKRLERIPGTDPAAFKMISDNPNHSAYERTQDEIHLIGRVVWLARKI